MDAIRYIAAASDSIEPFETKTKTKNKFIFGLEALNEDV